MRDELTGVFESDAQDSGHKQLAASSHAKNMHDNNVDLNMEEDDLDSDEDQSDSEGDEGAWENRGMMFS